MRILSIIILLSVCLGCSDGGLPLNQDVSRIPPPVQVTVRPLLDTDLTFYSYFNLDGGPEKVREDGETTLLKMVRAGLVISQAWLGTVGECGVTELAHSARLVVRLLEADPNVVSFGFTGDPVPATAEYPWTYWYVCADKLTWRYDFNLGPDVEIPEPTQVPNEYPVPDSPTTYYRPWYVWGVTEEEWRGGIDAFVTELVREGISLEQVSAPIHQSDPCGQVNWCNTDVLIVTTAEPEPKLVQRGIMGESSNCMNICPETLLRYRFGEDGE